MLSHSDIIKRKEKNFPFHILAIANNAAVNMEIHVSFLVSVFVFFGYIPRVELLDHMIVIYLVF